MEERPKPTELMRAMDISLPYASQLLSGVRTPSRVLALRIFVRFGLKLGSIARLDADEIRVLAKMEGVDFVHTDPDSAAGASASPDSAGDPIGEAA